MLLSSFDAGFYFSTMLSTLKRKIPLRFPPRRIYHHCKGWHAASKYGFPANKLKVIGITGTNGKTSSTLLVASILKATNKSHGLLSSLYQKTGDETIINPTKFTTLTPYYLQRQLGEMVKNKLEWAVLEVTSHALDQGRTNGIPFDIVALTNISPEHLDYHGTMQEYRRAKSRLFANLAHCKRKNGLPKIAILDASLPEFADFDQFPADCKYYYSIDKAWIDHLKPSDSWLYASKIRQRKDGTDFDLITANGRISINLRLPGLFNVKNALLAAAVGLAMLIDLKTIKIGLEAVTAIPGRLEWVPTGKGFSVLLDYAVTPDSLELLHDLVKDWHKGRLIQVFGACGDRDRSKRPIMGEIVGKNADIAILTDEDPYGEDPMQIINELAIGLEKTGRAKGKDYFVIRDRSGAIKKALSLAKEDDLVLITGKGAETLMQFADRTIPWSDKEEVAKALKDLG